MQEIGNVDKSEMHRTFNMGVGMVVVVNPENTEAVKTHFEKIGQVFYEIGRVTEGDGHVNII